MRIGEDDENTLSKKRKREEEDDDEAQGKVDADGDVVLENKEGENPNKRRRLEPKGLYVKTVPVKQPFRGWSTPPSGSTLRHPVSNRIKVDRPSAFTLGKNQKITPNYDITQGTDEITELKFEDIVSGFVSKSAKAIQATTPREVVLGQFAKVTGSDQLIIKNKPGKLRDNPKKEKTTSELEEREKKLQVFESLSKALGSKSGNNSLTSYTELAEGTTIPATEGNLLPLGGVATSGLYPLVKDYQYDRTPFADYTLRRTEQVLSQMSEVMAWAFDCLNEGLKAESTKAALAELDLTNVSKKDATKKKREAKKKALEEVKDSVINPTEVQFGYTLRFDDSNVELFASTNNRKSQDKLVEFLTDSFELTKKAASSKEPKHWLVRQRALKLLYFKDQKQARLKDKDSTSEEYSLESNQLELAHELVLMFLAGDVTVVKTSAEGDDARHAEQNIAVWVHDNAGKEEHRYDLLEIAGTKIRCEACSSEICTNLEHEKKCFIIGKMYTTQASLANHHATFQGLIDGTIKVDIKRSERDRSPSPPPHSSRK
jgi:hypothetical protein